MNIDELDHLPTPREGLESLREDFPGLDEEEILGVIDFFVFNNLSAMALIQDALMSGAFRSDLVLKVQVGLT